jgi:hypothetical protein
VEFLNGLRLSAEVEGAWQELTNPPTLALARYEVPELADVLVVPGDPPLPGTGAAAPSPKGRPVPIRPPREVC